MAVFCAILRSCAILTGDRRLVVDMRCAARESVSWRVVVGVVFLIVSSFPRFLVCFKFRGGEWID